MFSFLRKVLWPLEIIALLGAAAGFALTRLELIMISMSALACVLFLNAFIPPTTDEDESESPAGFFDLLAGTICIKVGWMGSALTVIGILFRVLHFPGAIDMLMISIPALFMSIVLMVVYAVARSRSSRVVPVLYRAVPICLFGVYFFMNRPA